MTASLSVEGDTSLPASWSGCVQQICDLGFSAGDADTMLRRAHGWQYQKYWRKKKDHETPEEDTVR